MAIINQQYLLRPTTTPEQEILINAFFAKFNNGSAANKNIINCEQVFFQGAIGGSEFTTYNANKLYLVFSSLFGGSSAGASP